MSHTSAIRSLPSVSLFIMFRASDIFGRKPGQSLDKPAAKAKAAVTQKPLGPTGPTTRQWDPATGTFIEEEIPEELQELMGVRKKPKVEDVRNQDHTAAWRPQPLGPQSVGYRPPAPPPVRFVPPPRGVTPQPRGAVTPQQAMFSAKSGVQVDRTAPSVQYSGFCKAELNDRFYEKSDLPIHGRPTYWAADAVFFIYWQGSTAQRWSFCDATSLEAVRAGQLPGWAYKGDHRHLCHASGWMEAWNGEWREAELEVTFRSSCCHKPQWEDPLAQRSVETIEFQGFAMKDLNARYHLRPEEHIQGKSSYWAASGVYFIYWQQGMSRWAICDLKCLDSVRAGSCPGWAFREDSGHPANASGWKEARDGDWLEAKIETAVIGASAKGLKVQLSGFGKQELNVQYVETPSIEVQGRATLWEATGNYFIYWQLSTRRWAICDKSSLSTAQSGLTPGWAYRTDSLHFAKASSWMEADGRGWSPVTIQCRVLEGSITKEPPEAESDGSGTQLSAEQYRSLIREVYERKNPAKLQEFDTLLEKYQGRENEFFKSVCDKYEVDPEELAASLGRTAGAASSSPAVASDSAAMPAADVASATLPKLSPTGYAMLIQSIYERHKPEKIADLARLLQHHRHKERELYLEVCSKYGVHPVQFHAEQCKEQSGLIRAKLEPT